MGLIENLLPLLEPSDAALPPASSYRLFQCHCCLVTVVLCSRCDRGNIYCDVCAPYRKRKRIAAARRKYRSFEKGKSVRAASEKLRRRRLKLRPQKENVGDRGSPEVAAQGNTSASEQSRSDSGVPVDEDSINSSPPVVDFGSPPTPQGFVRCSNCHEPCEDFQIQGPRRRRFARRPRSRSPPHACSDGGGTP
jgi:hypothetical protein